MAKETATVAAAPVPARSIGQLKSEYEALAKRVQGFDRETRELIRKRADEQKGWAITRKKEKAELMAAKLRASTAYLKAVEAAAPKINHAA